MPLLVRYCLNALWAPFFLATGCTLFILNLLFELKEFLDDLFKYHWGFSNCVHLLIYIQPSFLILAIPFGFLAAILIVYGRLSADRETIAIESCGFPLSTIIWPAIGAGILLSVFLVFLMDKVIPWGNVSYLKLQYKVASERSGFIVKLREFIEDFNGYVLYVEEKDERQDILKGITVEFLDERKYPYRLILAKEGFFRQDPKNYHAILDLKNGIMQQLGMDKKKTMDEFLQMQFSACSLDLSSNQMSSGPLDFSDSRNISIKQLAARIKEDKQKKSDSRRDETELHKKFSIPFSALAFALIGIPLGLLSRSGSFMGLFYAVVLTAIWTILTNFGDVMGPEGGLSPFVAMWLPNFALMVVGVVLVYWLHHKYDFWRNLWRQRAEISRSSDPL